MATLNVSDVMHKFSNSPYSVRSNLESGASLVEAAIVLPLLVFLCIALTEAGFALSTWYGMNEMANQAVHLGVTVPAPTGLNPQCATRTAGNCGVVNSYRLVQNTGLDFISCRAVRLAESQRESRLLFLSGPLSAQACITGTHPNATLTITISGTHMSLFRLFAGLNLQGSDSARYVYYPY